MSLLIWKGMSSRPWRGEKVKSRPAEEGWFQALTWSRVSSQFLAVVSFSSLSPSSFSSSSADK